MPDFALTDRVALITGSSRGLGLAIAQGLAEAGAKVILHGRDPARLEATAAAFPNRLGDFEQEALAGAGRLDAVGHAGIVPDEHHGRLIERISCQGSGRQGPVPPLAVVVAQAGEPVVKLAHPCSLTALDRTSPTSPKAAATRDR